MSLRNYDHEKQDLASCGDSMGKGNCLRASCCLAPHPRHSARPTWETGTEGPEPACRAGGYILGNTFTGGFCLSGGMLILGPEKAILGEFYKLGGNLTVF